MSADVPLLVSLPISVAWGEQDAFGHVNNVMYFRYFESVRMLFLERIGILRSHVDLGIGVILASTTCDFLRPVHWPAELIVRTGCVKVGTTSFTLRYEITDGTGNIVATGSSVQVMYDYRAATKVPIPASVRSVMATLQAP